DDSLRMLVKNGYDARAPLSVHVHCVARDVRKPGSDRGTGGSDHSGNKVYRMTVQRMRERIVKARLLSDEEVDRFLADLQSPELHAITAIHCAAWGRKPAEQVAAPDPARM